jgi:hypothetical protein
LVPFSDLSFAHCLSLPYDKTHQQLCIWNRCTFMLFLPVISFTIGFCCGQVLHTINKHHYVCTFSLPYLKNT